MSPVDDTRTGVDRKDRYLKDKLMSQFVNHDSTSRPCTKEYAEGWDRIFGKKQERPDTVDVVTPPVCDDCGGNHPTDEC